MHAEGKITLEGEDPKTENSSTGLAELPPSPSPQEQSIHGNASEDTRAQTESPGKETAAFKPEEKTLMLTNTCHFVERTHWCYLHRKTLMRYRGRPVEIRLMWTNTIRVTCSMTLRSLMRYQTQDPPSIPRRPKHNNKLSNSVISELIFREDTNAMVTNTAWLTWFI